MPDDEDTTPIHVIANRISWDADADNWVKRGRTHWAAGEITWGIWGVPESELGLLPDVRGLDVVELGCGTGYVSSWLSRRGARDVGWTSPRSSSSRRGCFRTSSGSGSR